MKTAILTFLCLATLPVTSRAQAILNLPSTEGESGAITFDSFTPDDSLHGGYSGHLKSTELASMTGDLSCPGATLRAAPVFRSGRQAGLFAFDSRAKCDEIALGMIEHPGLRVRFQLRIAPLVDSQTGVLVTGTVTAVEWIDSSPR